MQVKHRIRLPFFALLSLSVVAISSMLSAMSARDDDSKMAALQAAISGPQRFAANKARDKYRHRLETLTFFGIKPDMTVVEI
jgi:predicted methyltransferase